MNLGKNDLVVTMAASIAVIFMSFTFPALGMTGNQQTQADIPDFNISKGTVEFANEEPQYPARPSEGTLTYVNGSASWEDERQVDLQTGDPRYLLSFFDDEESSPNPQYHVNLIKFNASGSFTEDTNINTSESKTLTSVDGAYEIGINNLEILNSTQGNESASVDWNVISQPSDQTWLGRVPIVGSIISGTNQLAAIVGWIASIAWYMVTQILVAIGNAMLMFFNVIVYFIDFSWWLTSTYTSIVGGAPTAWASVIVAIPGVLLGFQFAKIVAVGISLLPFT